MNHPPSGEGGPLTSDTCGLPQPLEGSIRERIGLLLLFLLFVLGCYPTLDLKVQDNLYTQQAASWLKGRMDIDLPGTDVVQFGERLFVPFPPFPSVLLLPFVFFLGEEGTSPVLVVVLLTAINLVLIRSLVRRCQPGGTQLVWIVAAFVCGTGYWTEAVLSSGVWALAHMAAVTALFFALSEVLGRGRGWLVGIGLGAAFLSRQLTLFSIFFLCVALWLRKEDSRSRRVFNQVGLWTATGLSVGIYLIYNWARFEDPFQTGYELIETTGGLKERLDMYGLFSPVYIPFNLTWFFLQGFQVVFTGSTYTQIGGVSPYGTAMTFASPFLFLAFMAKWERPLLWAAWFSTAIIFGIFMCYYNNGWVQFNTQRFSLDFIPLMVPLVALGCQQVRPVIWKGLIAYSVGLNILTVLLQFWLPYLRSS